MLSPLAPTLPSTTLHLTQQMMTKQMVKAYDFYKMGMCYRNIHGFTWRLFNTGILTKANMSHGNLLMCVPSDNGISTRLGDATTIKPKSTVLPATVSGLSMLDWRYHVVFDYGRAVYDFDYNGQPGVDLVTWAQAVFGEDLLTEMDVVLLPAKKVIEGVLTRNTRLWGLPNTSDYTRLAFPYYLKQRSQKYDRTTVSQDLPNLSQVFQSRCGQLINITKHGMAFDGFCEKFSIDYKAGKETSQSQMQHVLHVIIKASLKRSLATKEAVTLNLHLEPGHQIDTGFLKQFIGSKFGGKVALVVLT